MHFHKEGGDGRGFGRAGFRMAFGPRGFGGRHGRGFAMSWSPEEGFQGRRRMFGGDELKLVLLKLIAEQPRHGYDLIRAIEERTGGAYAPSPGVVYPTLTLLADMGQTAEQASEGARKLFAVTPDGEAHLAAKAEEVTAIFARLDAMAEERERGDPMPVKRAMHNLRSVLKHRLFAGELDKEQLHAVVELIDEAARKIERL